MLSPKVYYDLDGKTFLRKSIRSRRSRLEEIMVTSYRLSFGDPWKRCGGASMKIYLSLLGSLGYRFPAKAENIMERDTNPPHPPSTYICLEISFLHVLRERAHNTVSIFYRTDVWSTIGPFQTSTVYQVSLCRFLPSCHFP